MLRSESLVFHYPGSTAMDFPSFELPQKEHLLIHGASGSGKSTWLQLLSGIRRADQGNVYYDQTDLHQLSSRKKEAFCAQQIGIIFQEHHFIPSLTAKENCLIGLQTSSDQTQFLQRKAEQLGLAPLLTKKPHHLSVGERQRLAILRTLIRRPRWVFADEPTSSLDDQHCESVIQLLLSECESLGASLIVVTHDQRVTPYFERSISR
ncbi:MAG: ATP-binding cassette domain-containing protein [Bacteroidota bacterium]|nr:ATP-binding cassette domain-containing protein [Bacteroidota bacterium]MDX5431324.1 ATP-binding cassette domain-containing protein [Bacteroidota bacterium]MDX5470062.1 ATP-binding cassette domain-containing protein [Bacteroidota bacterium]